MPTKRARPAEHAEAARLARELVEDLAALATALPGATPTRPEAADEPPSGTPPLVKFDLAGPRTMLENAERFLSPYLPADSRFRALKALVLRSLRIVTRDQSVFNAALYDTVRFSLLEIETALNRLAALATAVREAGRHAEESASRRSDELAAHLGTLESDSSNRLAALGQAFEEEARERRAAEGREAAARERMADDVHGSQRRLDAVERRLETDAAERSRDAERRDAAGAALRAELASVEEAARLARLEWSTLKSTFGSAATAGAGGAAKTPRTELSTTPLAVEPAPSGPAVGLDPGDPFRAGLYADFERSFRGSEEEIRRRQAADVALFSAAPGPVADVGCGRGEFLELLREAGREAIGCDANPVMAARAREKGLAVDAADLFDWLAARADGSLGGVTAYQVVEHLPPARVFDLVELALRKLAPGGTLLLETINPESLFAMKWFWMDLSHVRPYAGPSLAQLFSAAGLRDVRVDYRSPVPAVDALPPELADDGRFQPIARLLFAPQDYAVIGVA